MASKILQIYEKYSSTKISHKISKSPYTIIKCFCNYLATRSLRSCERGEVVRFSGFARKTNYIPLFCERSEQKCIVV
ncbi:MAG: hypothetical protein U5L45_02890 [Saprospiraceae bacterium]|nr:hypothetical protein [Saprospiraceae bacterium]